MLVAELWEKGGKAEKLWKVPLPVGSSRECRAGALQPQLSHNSPAIFPTTAALPRPCPAPVNENVLE